MRRKQSNVAFIAIAASLFTTAAPAGIVKTASVDCGKGEICLFWWPRLPSLPGWHSDQTANRSYGENGMNSLVPDGVTFRDADTVMYASATYKPRYERENPESRSLNAFISDDKSFFASEHPDMSIAEVEPLITGDGQTLRSFTYFRPRDSSWERVSYGEEGDYYIVFTISARSAVAYRKAQAAYVDIVRRYTK